MREVIYGKRRQKQYWLLKTDPETLPSNSTSYVMVSAPNVKLSEIGVSNVNNMGRKGLLKFRLFCIDY